MDEIWLYIIENEDRILYNSDQKHRKHFCAIHNALERKVYTKTPEAFTTMEPMEQASFHFLDLIENDILYHALTQLTEKQREVLELIFLYKFQKKEVAELLHCSPAAISKVYCGAISNLKVNMYREMKKETN